MQENLLANPATIDSAWEIWERRKEGQSYYAIAKELGLSTLKVRNIVEACQEELIGEIKDQVIQEKAIAIQRAEGIILQYTPVMKAGKVQVQRFDSKGEPYTDDDWKYCLQAGHLVLKAINEIAKLHGIYETQTKDNGKINDRILVFLKESMPTIRSIVDAQPVEIPAQRSDAKSVDLSFDVTGLGMPGSGREHGGLSKPAERP